MAPRWDDVRLLHPDPLAPLLARLPYLDFRSATIALRTDKGLGKASGVPIIHHGTFAEELHDHAGGYVSIRTTLADSADFVAVLPVVGERADFEAGRVAVGVDAEGWMGHGKRGCKLRKSPDLLDFLTALC